jgi:tRNA U55 pseudouridine synthase TruB
MMGSVAMLDSLKRSGSGALTIKNSMPLSEILDATVQQKNWDELSCWVPFHRLLDGYDRAEATTDEALALRQGRQNVLFNILKRVERPEHCQTGNATSTHIAIFSKESLIAIAALEQGVWGVERVFVE